MRPKRVCTCTGERWFLAHMVETSEPILTVRYILAVFAAVSGVIQAASARAGIRGLMFFPCHVRFRLWPSLRYVILTPVRFSYLFAGITVIPALLYMFGWNEYNEVGLIEGSEQALWFVLGTFAAGIFCLLLSSLINHRCLQHNQTQAQGLEALKETTWVQSFRRRWVRKNK